MLGNDYTIFHFRLVAIFSDRRSLGLMCVFGYRALVYKFIHRIGQSVEQRLIVRAHVPTVEKPSLGRAFSLCEQAMSDVGPAGIGPTITIFGLTLFEAEIFIALEFVLNR